MARGLDGPPAKQSKKEPQALPTNVIVQFQNDAGEVVGVLQTPGICNINL